MAGLWKRMTGTRRRRAVLGVVLLVCVVAGLTFRPARHLLNAYLADVDEREPIPIGFADDASRLNLTPVAEVWAVPPDPAQAEEQLRELLARARREGLKVSIAGARHSMGGHTIALDGIVIDMLPFHAMRLDPDRDVLQVGAGARWFEIIRELDRHGRSPAVMQSNNAFTVGGSISVNCHGWQYDRPPIASTVESLRIMLADGRVVRASREENAELFSLALGGYGLFGIILDVELRAVANECYRSMQYVVPVTEALETFETNIASHPDARMVYARMNVTPERLFDEVLLTAFLVEPLEPPPLETHDVDTLRRIIFRGSASDDYGKALRWDAETKLNPLLAGRLFSRNQLLNAGTEQFENRSRSTTDILHEYFVPRDRAAAFAVRMRDVLRKHDANLLNVTVREINEDVDTFLRYADQPVFSFVMLFVQKRTPEAEVRMAELTQELIDLALDQGGRYYLPYRLHATPEQFRRAYPRAEEFFRKKREYDPDELFQNAFYKKYGGGEGASGRGSR